LLSAKVYRQLHVQRDEIQIVFQISVKFPLHLTKYVFHTGPQLESSVKSIRALGDTLETGDSIIF